MLYMGGGGVQKDQVHKESYGKTKWYIVCCKGETKVTKENEVGDCKILTQAFESQKEALEVMRLKYPNKKC